MTEYNSQVERFANGESSIFDALEALGARPDDIKMLMEIADGKEPDLESISYAYLRSTIPYPIGDRFKDACAEHLGVFIVPDYLGRFHFLSCEDTDTFVVISMLGGSDVYPKYRADVYSMTFLEFSKDGYLYPARFFISDNESSNTIELKPQHIKGEPVDTWDCPTNIGYFSKDNPTDFRLDSNNNLIVNIKDVSNLVIPGCFILNDNFHRPMDGTEPYNPRLEHERRQRESTKRVNRALGIA